MQLTNKKKNLKKYLKILKLLSQPQNLLRRRSLNKIKKHNQNPEIFGQNIKNSK
jgi:hypothetical protein